MKLEFLDIEIKPELTTTSILELAKTLPKELKPTIAEIDKQYMGGKDLCDHYAVNIDISANCVIVEVFTKEKSFYVAVVVPVGYKADINGIVKKCFNAKRVSFANLEKVLEQTKMEYGSITPFGLPKDYKIIVDKRLMEKEHIVVGGGKQISKLLLPTKNFTKTLGALVIEGLGKK